MADQTYRVTIEGESGTHVVLATQPVSYTRSHGVSPDVLAVRLANADAVAIHQVAGRGSPFTLRVETPDAGDYEIGPWYWVANQPTEVPEVGAAVFQDRRTWWNNRFVRRMYNLKRRVGFVRLTNPGSAGNYVVDQVSPDVAWRERTLFNGQPWTPSQILVDILASVDPDAEIVVTPGASAIPNPNVDAVDIMGQGGDAVAQALRQLPELTIGIRPDGVVKIYSRAEGLAADERLARKLRPHVKGSSSLVIQDLTPVCPPAIDVIFPYECEVRFDAIEGEQPQGSTVQGAQVIPDPPVTEPDRRMRNVAVVADYEIEINGRTEVQGTYAPWDAYLQALPEAPTGVTLTGKTFRRGLIPGSSIMSEIAEIGKVGDEKDNWPARVGSLQSSYRTLYRLPRGWVDSSIAIKPVRVATVDQEKGARAPAIVFADYFVVPSGKNRLRQGRSGAEFVDLGENIAGWVDAVSGDTIPAPARVSVVDEEQGIVQFQFVTEPWAESAMFLPSQIDVGAIPAIQGRRQRSKSVTYNAVLSTRQLPELSEDHRLGTILTMIPIPDVESRCYRVRINAADILDRLPQAARDVAANARGQILEIGLPPSEELTARIPWTQDTADVIERIFLAPDSLDPASARKFVINDTEVQTTTNDRGAGTGASIRLVAEAVAIRRYSSYARHYQGTIRSGQQDGWGLSLDGYAESITTTVDQTGARSELTYGSQLPLYDWQTILDPGTRALLFRQVLRGGD